MRELIRYGSFAVLLLFSTNIFAQKTATAVMTVSATVISGGTLTNVTSMDINFEDKSVHAGGFAIQTSDAQETMVESSESVTLQNEFGDEMTIIATAESATTEDLKNVRILAEVEEANPAMRGTYTGSVTTTVSYF